MVITQPQFLLLQNPPTQFDAPGRIVRPAVVESVVTHKGCEVWFSQKQTVEILLAQVRKMVHRLWFGTSNQRATQQQTNKN